MQIVGGRLGFSLKDFVWFTGKTNGFELQKMSTHRHYQGGLEEGQNMSLDELLRKIQQVYVKRDAEKEKARTKVMAEFLQPPRAPGPKWFPIIEGTGSATRKWQKHSLLSRGEPTQTAAGKESVCYLLGRGTLGVGMFTKTAGPSGGGSPGDNGDGLLDVSGAPIVAGTHHTRALVNF